MLVVIDTDVLVSTAGHPDKRFAIWDAVRTRRVTPVTTDAAIAELEDVAARPLVRLALPLLEKNFQPFLSEYRSVAMVIRPPPQLFILQVDTKDSLFFNIAIEVQTEILTTFNVRHILPVRGSNNPQYQELRRLAPNLRLLHPKEFARELIRMP